MKKILFLLLTLTALGAGAQTYVPSENVPINKSIGISIGAPVDARTYYYDNTFFKYRPYQNINEVYSYLNLTQYRQGSFPIVVNTGGVLSSGVITGGINNVYWFRNGTTNSDLVLFNNINSVNGQTGTVVSKSADSLKGIPLDTTVHRDDYVITYDSVARKYYLAPAGSGSTYTAGTGINISGGVVSALTSTALWNASQLRGRSISTAAPSVGTIPKWTGTSFDFMPDLQALDTAFYESDTLYLVSGLDTSKVVIAVTLTGDNWGTQSVRHDSTLTGAGIDIDELKVDTVNWIGTKHDVAYLQEQFDNLDPSDVGSKTQVLNYGGSGDSLSIFINDSLYKTKRIIAGANVSITNVGDSALSISSLPGTAEINTIAATYTTTDSVTIPASVIDYILVKPASNLSGIKIGTATDDDAFVTSTPVNATADFDLFVPGIYLTASTKIYFSGITSSTQIKIIYKPLHE